MNTRLRFFLLAIALLSGGVAACGDDSSASRGSAVVTLDVFSGMPNPTWVLTPEQTAELLVMWDDLDETGATEYPGYLGYRGVVVDFADGSKIWVSNRVAVDEESGTARADSRRDLERQILETGQGTIDPTLLDELLSTLSQR